MFNVLGALYEAAELRKNELRDYVNSRLDALPDADEYWFHHEGEDDSLSKAALAAASGVTDLSGLRLTAINTEVISDSDEVIEGSILDVLEPHAGLKDRVRNLKAICEFRTSINAVNELKPDLLLMDGSLIGTVIRPVKYDRILGTEVKTWIRKNCLKEIANSTDEVSIHSRSFDVTLRETFRSYKPVVYLEGLERLISIWKLLRKTKNIIAVSRMSTMSDIFEDIPDITVFNDLTNGMGHSIPIHRKLSEIKRKFPVLDAFFKSLEFTVFYARLEDDRGVLKFEVPQRVSTGRVEDYIENMRSSSADGYPYLLRRVKDDVRITEADMDVISGMIYR